MQVYDISFGLHAMTAIQNGEWKLLAIEWRIQNFCQKIENENHESNAAVDNQKKKWASTESPSVEYLMLSPFGILDEFEV